MLRAVEKFEQVLPMAVRLASFGGRVALMIGSGQSEAARKFGKDVNWGDAVPIPCSNSRELLVGARVIKVE